MKAGRRPPRRTPLLFLLASLAGPAHAASIAEWEACSAILEDADRLACYDRVSGRSQPEAASPPDMTGETLLETAEPELLTTLSRHWELDDEAKQGAFLFRAHRANYLLPLKYSSSPNSTPFQESVAPAEDLGLDPVEAELQLSFKI